MGTLRLVIWRSRGIHRLAACYGWVTTHQLALTDRATLGTLSSAG
jgi:hypothetical protein